MLHLEAAQRRDARRRAAAVIDAAMAATSGKAASDWAAKLAKGGE